MHEPERRDEPACCPASGGMLGGRSSGRGAGHRGPFPRVRPHTLAAHVAHGCSAFSSHGNEGPFLLNLFLVNQNGPRGRMAIPSPISTGLYKTGPLTFGQALGHTVWHTLSSTLLGQQMPTEGSRDMSTGVGARLQGPCYVAAMTVADAGDVVLNPLKIPKGSWTRSGENSFLLA